MSQSAKAQEPSMEEILASIRRIISDDDAKAEPQAPAPAAEPSAAPAMDAEGESDILDLTEAMATRGPNVVGFRPVDGQPDVVFGALPPEVEAPPEPLPETASTPEPEPPPESEPPAEPEPPAAPTVVEARRRFEHETTADRSLLSPPTAAAVDSAFNTLAHTVLVQNARTLDDLVREMLRPMLKAWLDDNLPSMVERLVRAEIERVSRGRG